MAKRVTFESIREQGKPVLLFFSEPGCGACDAALPELAQWQREFAERISIIPISTGSVEANRTKIKKHNVRNLLLQKKRETAEAYRIEGTPGAVLITGGLVASPVASGIDAIRALVTRATLPPSVKKGDAAPSFKLPDLKGTAVNLGNLRRRTLLLFWNPSCGFCQQMLEDVKAWEHQSPQFRSGAIGHFRRSSRIHEGPGVSFACSSGSLLFRKPGVQLRRNTLCSPP